MSANSMKPPPRLVVLVAVLTIALGATAGAAMSQLREPTEWFARARIEANRQAHGLTGSKEYDDEVVGRAVFTAEAGLSFLHTHAEGLGPLVLVGSSLAATLVASRRLRGLLHALFALAALFPLGYLAYGLAVLELGRDDGIALAETWVLTPLGTAAIVALVVLLVALGRDRRDAGVEPAEPGRA
jgi:hypothetical protein